MDEVMTVTGVSFLIGIWGAALVLLFLRWGGSNGSASLSTTMDDWRTPRLLRRARLSNSCGEQTGSGSLPILSLYNILICLVAAAVNKLEPNRRHASALKILANWRCRMIRQRDRPLKIRAEEVFLWRSSDHRSQTKKHEINRDNVEDG
jgi:hypothetical protein